MSRQRNNFKMLDWQKKQPNKKRKNYLETCFQKQGRILKNLRNNKLMRLRLQTLQTNLKKNKNETIKFSDVYSMFKVVIL